MNDDRTEHPSDSPDALTGSGHAIASIDQGSTAMSDSPTMAATSEAVPIAGNGDPTLAPTRSARAKAAVSGVLAAGIALGAGELLAGFTNRIPSLLVRVGDVVIKNVPGSVEQWAIETLGKNDKPALIIGIIVISLLVGAVTGIASAKDFRIAWFVFAVFGLIGGLAAASDPQRPSAWGWLVAIVAALAGLGALRLLLAHAAPSAPATVAAVPVQGRRNFVTVAGAVAAVGVAAPVLGTTLRRRHEAAVQADREQIAAALGDVSPTAIPETRTSGAAPANFDDIAGIATLITPNDGFYRIDAALSVPRIDVDSWSMKITGMVDNEVEFTFDDLLAMDTVEEFVTLSCVSNRVGGDLVGNAQWLGVPLKTLLDLAGVQPGATQIVGRSVDGWTGGFPTSYLDDPNRVALVAVAMNGEPLPVEHGFPVRLVVAGLYGYVSATKWLKEIELTTLEDFDGYWITRGWSKLGPIKTQSRIDVPRSNSRIEAGKQPIAGVAWAPDRGVDRVEVQVIELGDPDIPGPWIEAELSSDVTDNSWRQWFLDWDAPAGDHVIRVRATDGTGETQTEERTDVAPSGATGWHAVAVRVG